MIKQACDKLKIPVVPSRLSILTKPHNGRAACHYCGQCGRGCATHSNFSSTSVMLPPALKTGKLTIIANAMAREVMTDAEGLATGVSYIDTQKNAEHQVRAKAVVLAASCCESARLLLNSKSTRHPGGLANSSGVVGKYLTDSTGLNVSGFVPKLMDVPRYNADGIGGMHLYVPWWGDNKKLGFARGYHIELGGGFGMPGYGFGGGIQNYPQSRGGGYGKELKDEYRRYYGAFVGFSGRGEQVSREDCHCDIDPNVVDQLGHPGAALPPHVERSGAPAGEAHAGDLPQHHHGDGRHADVGRCRPRSRTTAWRSAASSSTRPARPAWATIRRPRRSTGTARRTTRRTCSSATAARSSRRPTRT